MVGFIRKKVESYTLAEQLIRLREEAGISLAEISKSTKIRKDYLEKMEQGKFEELPADVYVKGFLRSYAQFLGVSPEEVIRKYEKERGIRDNINRSKKTQNLMRDFRLPMITITPKMFTAVVFIILVLGGVGYFYREVGKFSQVPRLVVMQPLSDISIDGSSIEVAGTTDRDSKISINGQPVFVNERGEFNETLSLQQGLNAIVIKAVNRFGKEVAKTYNVSSNYEPKLSESGSSQTEIVAGAETEAATNNQDGKISVEIRIEDSPTWVSIDADGNNVQSGTMLPGSVQTFEADQQISITSGKANKTFVKLNGNDLGKLGESPGVVRDVLLSRSTTIIPKAPTDQKDEALNDNSNSKEQSKNN